MLSAAAKPAIMIWGTACASQGPLDAAMARFAALQNEILYFVQTRSRFIVFALAWPRN
jgi:hypothetical protein